MNDKPKNELAQLLQLLLTRRGQRVYVQLMERLGVSPVNHQWLL